MLNKLLGIKNLMNLETYGYRKYKKSIIVGLIVLFWGAVFSVYQYGYADAELTVTTKEEDSDCRRIASGLYNKFRIISPEATLSNDMLTSSLTSHIPRYNTPNVITVLATYAPINGEEFIASLQNGKVKKSKLDELLLEAVETCSDRLMAKLQNERLKPNL